MTFPSFLLGILLATLYGSLFHLWRGGEGKTLLFYIILAWAGFFAGHFLALWLGRTLYAIGTLQFGFATLGGILFLLLGDWLGRIE